MNQTKLSLIDRAVLAVNPKRGAERIVERTMGMVKIAQAQHLQDVVHGHTVTTSSGTAGALPRVDTRWRGASQSLKSMTSWVTSLLSGRQDLPKQERERLTARSYDAYRNHLVARAIVSRGKTGIVGVGITAHPDVDHKVLGLSDEQADELNDLIAREWTLYYENPWEVDLLGMQDGYGLQTMALVQSMLAGDVFALTPFEERPGATYGLKVQLIDGARVSNRDGQPDSATLQDGIEMLPSGRPVRVHIRRRHPADALPGSVDGWDVRDMFGPAGERLVLQVWNERDRLGTTRGAPMLAAILEPLQTLEQYSRAELIAAVVSSMFTVFIKKTQPPLTDDKGNPLPAIEGQTVDSDGRSQLAMGSGAIVDLGMNEEAQFANPSRPNSNYDGFFLSVVRQIAAALELPVDEVLLSYNSSYSAARAAMLQAYRWYTARRYTLVQQFCQPHYSLWFDEAVARGRIPAVDYADPMRRAAYQKAMWIGPTRGAMQEKDEVQAARDRIDAGFSNETIETAAITGEPWRAVYAGRRREVNQRRADGMEQGPRQGQATAASGTPAPPGAPGAAPEPAPPPAPEPAPIAPTGEGP